MSEEGETLEEIYQEIVARRKNRDNFYLRVGKMVSSRELSEYWKEWIIQEIKDLLIMTSHLQNSSNIVLRDTAADIHGRVDAYNKKVTRTIIRPLTIISKGRVRAKSEMEHMEKFEKAIKNACEIVKELGKLRDTLDDTIESARLEVNTQHYRFYG